MEHKRVCVYIALLQFNLKIYFVKSFGRFGILYSLRVLPAFNNSLYLYGVKTWLYHLPCFWNKLRKGKMDFLVYGKFVCLKLF